MKKLFKAMAGVGGCLILGVAGTSDFYLKELVQDHPYYISILLIIGVALMLPALFMEEGDNDVHR